MGCGKLCAGSCWTHSIFLMDMVASFGEEMVYRAEEDGMMLSGLDTTSIS